MLLTKDRSREIHGRLVQVIEDALNRTGISARQASLDVTGHTNLIAGIKSGQMPSFDRMEALFEYLGIEITYGEKRFSGGFAEPVAVVPSRQLAKDDLFLPIPWLDRSFSAPRPPHVALHRDWLLSLDARVENLAFCSAPDDVMRPHYPQGTLFLIDKARRPTVTLDLFAVRIEGKLEMRLLLQPSPKALFIMRNDRDREPVSVQGAELASYIVQGQAIWAGAPIG